MQIKKDSVLSEIGECFKGHCSHHQVFDRIADNFEIIATDDDNMPHAIFNNSERFILGILWHCERSHLLKPKNSLYWKHNEENKKIFKIFF